MGLDVLTSEDIAVSLSLTGHWCSVTLDLCSRLTSGTPSPLHSHDTSVTQGSVMFVCVPATHTLQSASFVLTSNTDELGANCNVASPKIIYFE